MTPPDDLDSRTLTVAAHVRPTTGEALQVAPYTRSIRQQEVTFTCHICGKTYTQVQYPGAQRRYCNILCKRAS